MHHYSPHSLDLSTLIHDGTHLVYHIVAVADAENAPEISWEGTAVVAQQQQHLLLFLPSLIGNQCSVDGKKDRVEKKNTLVWGIVAVYNPAAVVYMELHLDLEACCRIEVLDAIVDNYYANADYDDHPGAAAAADVFDRTEQRWCDLNSLQRPRFLHLPGPVFEQFVV
jgi:hypothetical protein